MSFREVFRSVGLRRAEARRWRRCDLTSGMSALRTKLAGRGQLSSAVRADARQGRRAFLAELRAKAIVVLTPRTFRYECRPRSGFGGRREPSEARGGRLRSVRVAQLRSLDRPASCESRSESMRPIQIAAGTSAASYCPAIYPFRLGGPVLRNPSAYNGSAGRKDDHVRGSPFDFGRVSVTDRVAEYKEVCAVPWANTLWLRHEFRPGEGDRPSMFWSHRCLAC